MQVRSKRRPWSPEDREALAKHYPDTDNATLAKIFRRSLSSIKNEAVNQGLVKSASYMETNKPGQFRTGQATWNKGKSHPSTGRSPETQFRKGQKPHNWVPIGTERIADGYLQRKVTDTGDAKQDWRYVHHLVWEEKSGSPIPPGHAVAFIDGDENNIDPSNLELITREELMRRNSYHTNLPPEYAPIIQLRGVLTRKINKRTRDHEESNRRSP